MLYHWKHRMPAVDPTVYLAAECTLVGAVVIGEYSSVWHYAVIRADLDTITVGSYVNVQDHVCIHCEHGKPVAIGDYVTVGHGAVIHASTIGHRVLVGMRSVILDGAVIGDDSIIGAGAVVAPGTQVSGGSLVMGVPGRVVRHLEEGEKEQIARAARVYAQLAREAKEER